MFCFSDVDKDLRQIEKKYGYNYIELELVSIT